MAEKVCKHCGAALTGKANEVLPDGTEQERCSVCHRGYVIIKGKKPVESEPEPEPEPAPEPEPEPEPAPEPEPEPGKE